MTRGRSKRTLDLVEASQEILAAIQPASVRAVCYKLFVAGLIPSMAKPETNKVSRILVTARERGEVPWLWIIDETRAAERCSSWDAPADFVNCVIKSYRKDYWSQQPLTIQVWSEKATVSGTLRPLIDAYGVTFRWMHGFNSATKVKEAAEEARVSTVPLMVLYVGDFDPSGLYMSERDLPCRLIRYGAPGVRIIRLAITGDDVANSGLPSFAAAEKSTDTRFRWFVRNYGRRCVELDALDPRDLRDRVERAILAELDITAWDRCKAVELAERESLVGVMASWGRSVAGSRP